MDFIDACNIAYMKSREITKVATNDHKHYKRIEGIAILP
jgi:predicted nucleic acid-binding protein